MKDKGNKKRILAGILCIVIMLTGSGFAFPNNGGEPAQQSEQAELQTGQDETPAEQGGTPVQQDETPDSQDEQGGTPAAPEPVEVDGATIGVSENTTGAIPEGTALKAVPILPDNAETSDKYKEVAEKVREKVEEQGKELAGFLAYDLSLVDTGGEKVEPAGDVKVTINHITPVVPEGMDAEDTEVTVLHLEEDAGADAQKVTVVDLNKDEASGFKAETDGESRLQKAEFVTESLSCFVEAWMTKAAGISELDETGKEGGTGEPDAAVEADGGDKQVRSAGDITGYTVEIVDDVRTSGNLQAVIKDSKGEEVKDTTGITVTWLKNVNNIGFNPVDLIIYTNGDSNMDSEAHTLNIALDKGALSSSDNRTSVQYKVQIQRAGEVPVESEVYDVTYWNELRNGGFESPSVYECYPHDVNKKGNQWSNAQYAELGGVWQTTGLGKNSSKPDDKKDCDIEIIGFGAEGVEKAVINAKIKKIKEDQRDGGYNWEGEVYDAEGGWQFAELNCETEGALYQDVMTLKGVDMYYELYHRARGKKTNKIERDTMYLIIMPTKTAAEGITGISDEAIDTQAEVKQLIRAKLANDTLYKDVFVRKIISDDRSWQKYQGSYLPNSNLTRFFFVAGDAAEVASGDNTVGNFLDAVYFSQKLPTPRDKECQYQVKKIVEGLEIQDADTAKEVLKNLTFAVEITKSSGSTEKTIKGSDMDWAKNHDGTFTGTSTYKEKIATGETYTIKVKESGTEIKGAGQCTSQHSVSKDELGIDIFENGSDATTTVGSGKNAVVTFKNTYEKVNKNTDESLITVTKTFDGLDAEGIKELKSKFAINLYEADKPGEVWKSLGLEGKEVEKSEDGKTYTWQIRGAAATEYLIEESGAELEASKSKLTATVNGESLNKKTNVSIQEVNADITKINGQNIPGNKLNTINTVSNNFFAVKLGDGGYMIWTEEALSLNERQALRNAIAANSQIEANNPVKNINDANAKVIYYSEVYSDSNPLKCYGEISVSGSEFQFKDNINEVMWQSTTHGNYTIKDTDKKPEIQVTNSYTVDVDLQKFGSSYEMDQLAGATFSMCKGQKTEDNEIINWSIVEEYKNFEVKENTTELQGLSNGYYKLTETKAPEGYQCLSKPICFMVENGKVSLIEEMDGSSLQEDTSRMWKIEQEDNSNTPIVIKIKNNAVYALPSTGGMGIYWYIIGGTAIMMLCLLLIYKRRCNEAV